MTGTAVFLCDITGHMAEPWREAGYRIVLVDPQHPQSDPPGAPVERISDTVLGAGARLSRIVQQELIVFVAGFPPCTDVAVSGSRWFEDKRSKDPHFQAKAALVAEQCRQFGVLSGAPWLFENPVSVFSGIFGKPCYTFNPSDYTGFCADDNYIKKTCLWTGGGFKMPPPNKDLFLGDPDNRIHTAPPSADRANFRSATPKGFARAVFLANRPDTAAGFTSIIGDKA